jgi:hypothetical protein
MTITKRCRFCGRSIALTFKPLIAVEPEPSISVTEPSMLSALQEKLRSIVNAVAGGIGMIGLGGSSQQQDQQPSTPPSWQPPSIGGGGRSGDIGTRERH